MLVCGHLVGVMVESFDCMPIASAKLHVLVPNCIELFALAVFFPVNLACVIFLHGSVRASLEWLEHGTNQ